MGVDRKTGAYRVSGTLIAARRRSPLTAVDRSDMTVVGAIDRSFVNQTRTVRVFGVYNPVEESTFARVISTFHLRDDVSLEASGGWFSGGGTDALSLLATRDFFISA